MSKILTEDDLQREAQEHRCRAALKIIDVPDDVIWKLHGPLLFQMAHLCCVIDEPMHWRDALRWMHDHKGEILAHAEKTIREKYGQGSDAGSEADGAFDRTDALSAHKG